MPKGVKDGTVRIDAAELAALMRRAAPSRVAVVRAAQDFRRAHETLTACKATARARGMRPDCVEQTDAVGAALAALSRAALAVALDDE